MNLVASQKTDFKKLRKKQLQGSYWRSKPNFCQKPNAVFITAIFSIYNIVFTPNMTRFQKRFGWVKKVFLKYYQYNKSKIFILFDPFDIKHLFMLK